MSFALITTAAAANNKKDWTNFCCLIGFFSICLLIEWTTGAQCDHGLYYQEHDLTMRFNVITDNVINRFFRW